MLKYHEIGSIVFCFQIENDEYKWNVYTRRELEIGFGFVTGTLIV